MQVLRRGVLKAAAGMAAAAVMDWRTAALGEDTPPAVSRPARGPAEFQRRLAGPILSVPTPFTAQFELDTIAVRAMVDRAIQAGVAVFALTAGDGQYQWL